MGFISDLINFASAYIYRSDYLAESKKWYKEVWKHIQQPADGEGELVEINGRIYKQIRVSFSKDFTVVIRDEDDEGASIEELKLAWLRKTKLKYSGSATIMDL